MTINSLAFICFLLAALAVFHLAPGAWRARVVFPLTNLVFMALVMPSWHASGAVLGFAALIWLAARVITKEKKRGMMIGVVTMVLLIFGWLKNYSFLTFLPLTSLVPATIGLSYMLIRGLQLLADAREDPTLRPDALTVFSFLTSWPCLVSGPVQRFQDFEAQLDGMASFRLREEVWLPALARMVKGWLWVLVFGDIFKHLWLGLKGLAFAEVYPLAFGGSQLAFLLHLFFDFAGYTSIVIGAGALFGLRLPENFATPFAATSFLDFWARWHLTMSNWFKVYAFNPMLMTLTARWPSPTATAPIGAAAFFVTFFLVGLWHGSTAAFVICGLALGLCASVNQWYRVAMRKKLGKKAFDLLTGRRWYGLAAKGLAFASLCLAVLPLWLTGADIESVLGRYGWTGIMIAQAFVFVVMGLSGLLKLPVLPQPRALWWDCFKVSLSSVCIEMYLFLFPSFGGAFFYEQF